MPTDTAPVPEMSAAELREAMRQTSPPESRSSRSVDAGCRRTGTVQCLVETRSAPASRLPAGRACLAGRIPAVDARSGAVRPWPPCRRPCGGTVPQPQSETALASDRLRIMFFTRQVLEHDHVVVADQPGGGTCSEVCPRGRGLFRWARATLALAFGAVRATPSGSGPACAGSGRGPVRRQAGLCGFGIFSPSEMTAKSLMIQVRRQRKRPIAGSCPGSPHPTAKREVPAPTRVPRDGHRGRVDRCHVNIRPGPGQFQCRVHLGEERLPVAVPEPGARVRRGLAAVAGLVPRVPGPLREEVAERDLLVPDRLLEEGRRTTSLRNVEVFRGFHAGQVGVGLGEVRLGVLAVVPGVPPRRGSRFHTRRTQPNVRFSTAACSGAGYARHLYASLTS